MGAHTNPRLAFLGYGELASGIARGLKNEGVEVIKAFDILLGSGSKTEVAMRRLADEIGVELVTRLDELVSGADIVLATVTPASALKVASSIAPLLKEGQVYADLNSCSPALKKAARGEVEKSGASYVDVGVVGGVAIQGHRIPCLACGDGAENFKRILEPFGMSIRVINGRIGTAALIKMLRSVVLKGIEGLMLEMLTAARLYGLEDEMMESIAGTFDRGDFKRYSNMLMTTHAVHAGRRLDEAELVVETLRDAGITPFIAEGIRNFFAYTSGLNMVNHFEPRVPSNYKEVTAAIIELSKRKES
jgi:3-hydroxyisobutyrate dehydrogenase-like beta-hydroxyacid dehydrogenase